MKVNFKVILILTALALTVAVTIFAPEWINDSNYFLKSFVGEQLLSALGVILAINLASLAQLHLSLNKIEEKRGARFLEGARGEIRSSARWMIGLFVAAVAIVVIKPLVGADPRALAAVNGSAMFILGFYILIMADIVDAIFDMESDIDTPDEPPAGP